MQKHCWGDKAKPNEMASDMWWEWHPIESLKLPYTGHHLAREKEANQEQHGGGQ